MFLFPNTELRDSPQLRTRPAAVFTLKRRQIKVGVFIHLCASEML